MDKKRGNYGAGTVIKNKSGTITIRERYELGGKTVRKNFTAENITKAKQKRNEFELKMHLGELDQNTLVIKETFIEYMKNWAELYKQKSVKATTFDSIDYTIARINKYDFANYQLHQIDLDLCQNFFNQLTDDGYSFETIKKTYNQMNNCLKKAVSKGDIKINPLLEVELPSPDKVLKESKEIVVFDDEDVEKIYKEACATYSTGKPKYRYGCVIIFLLYTGLRIGECIGLDIQNIEIQTNAPKIHIDKTVSIVKNRNSNSNTKYKENISSPKTKNSKRTIPLSKKALEAVETAINQRNKDNNILFQSENGKRINARNVNRCLESILKNCDVKLKKASVHALRHTFASKLIRKGVDIKVVSELLGHTKVSTTYNIYAHLIKGEKTIAISLLD